MRGASDPGWDYESVVAAIDDMARHLGMLNKEVAEAIGMLPTAYSQKRLRQNNEFKLSEILEIIRTMRKRNPDVPDGWPFYARKGE